MTNERWQELVKNWLDSYASPHTRKVYGRAWRKFERWLGNRKKQPDQASSADLRAYSRQLRRRSIVTARQHLAALQSLYQIARLFNLVDHNPVQKLRRPPLQAYGRARWISAADAKRLLNDVETSTTQGKRDYAILLLMISCGLRSSEIATLRVGDLDSSANEPAILYTKHGGRPRNPNRRARHTLPPSVFKALRDYLGTRENAEVAAPLFVSYRKSGGIKGSLSAESIRSMVVQRSRKSLGRAINPRTLRTTTAVLANELAGEKCMACVCGFSNERMARRCVRQKKRSQHKVLSWFFGRRNPFGNLSEQQVQARLGEEIAAQLGVEGARSAFKRRRRWRRELRPKAPSYSGSD